MKKMLCLLTVVILLGSCKKDEDDAPIPAAPSVTLSNAGPLTRSVAPPKDSVLFGPFHLTVTEMPAFRIDDLVITFTGATDLSGLENLRFVIVEGSAEKFISPVLPTFGAVNPWSFVPPFPLATNRTYVIYIYADAVDVNMRTSIGVKLDVGYSWQGGVGLRTGAKAGPTISFVTATVTSSLSATTPPAGNVLANQKVETLAFTLKSIGQSATLTDIELTTPDAAIAQTAELYSGTNLLGSAPIIGSTAKIMVNVPIKQDTVSTYSVKLLLKPVTTEAQSQVNVKTAVTKVGYKTPSGQVRSNDTVRAGNNIYSYKSLPTIKRVELNQALDTTQQIPIFQYDITASSQGPIGNKQVTFDILLSDIVGNGASNDTLTLEDLGLYDGTTLVPVVFLNALGQPITTITEADTKVHAVMTSGAHQMVVQTTKRYTLKARPRGFKHPSDGDLIRTSIAPDLTPVPFGYRFVNRGTVGANAKLYTGPASSSAAVPVNSVFTDFANPTNSAAYTASTGDFFSGYGMKIDTTAQIISQ